MAHARISTDIEALLFAEGGALTKKKLCSTLACAEGELDRALEELVQKLAGRGLTLVQNGTEVALAVSPENRSAVAESLERDQARDIGEAGLEILAILLYEGPSTRATIDYVRGVNSSSTLRTLLTRGLVERSGNPEDGREFMYRPSLDLLAHLGVPNVQALPDYESLKQELEKFKKSAAVFSERSETRDS